MKQSLSTLHNFAGGLDIKQGRTSAKLRTGLHFNEVGTGNCVPIMLFTAGQIHKQERLSLTKGLVMPEAPTWRPVALREAVCRGGGDQYQGGKSLVGSLPTVSQLEHKHSLPAQCRLNSESVARIPFLLLCAKTSQRHCLSLSGHPTGPHHSPLVEKTCTRPNSL
jgi:hypothetical protein